MFIYTGHMKCRLSLYHENVEEVPFSFYSETQLTHDKVKQRVCILLHEQGSKFTVFGTVVYTFEYLPMVH